MESIDKKSVGCDFDVNLFHDNEVDIRYTEFTKQSLSRDSTKGKAKILYNTEKGENGLGIEMFKSLKSEIRETKWWNAVLIF